MLLGLLWLVMYVGGITGSWNVSQAGAQGSHVWVSTFFHFQNLKAFQCGGFFLCVGGGKWVCMHAPTLPVCLVLKEAGRCYEQHICLVGDSKERFKEHQQLPVVLFYLLCFVWTQSWAHHMMRAGAICTMSWLLQCKRMWVLHQAGQIKGFWWGSIDMKWETMLQKWDTALHHNVLQCYIPVDLNHSSPRIRIHLVLNLMLHSSHSKLHLSNS